jgi:hypothetical protein
VIVKILTKIFLKNFPKPIDKRSRIWYTKDSQEAVSLAKVWVATAKQTTTEKIFQKLLKNLLTNCRGYGTMYL